MSFEQLKKITDKLLNTIDDNEKFLAPVLASKVNKALENYPNDSTMLGMASVLNKYASNNNFITRGQLKKLYNQFHSYNNKFAHVFSDELGETSKTSAPVVSEQRFNDGETVKTDHLGDQVLSNALESMFDNNGPLKLYAKDIAEKSLKSVASMLSMLNMPSNSLSVATGNEKYIVVKADYETPKGKTSFYIPVEILGNKIASPSLFVGNGAVKDLNSENVKTYVKKFAGSKLNIDGDTLLTAITKAASENREVSDVEMAVIKLNASKKQEQEYFANGILNQKVEEEVKEISLPKYSEFSHFEEKFTTNYGQASFNFGQDKVNAGRDVIARKLSSFGLKNPQIKVASSNDKQITYAVSIDSGRIAFSVPVKVSENKVQVPEVMICKGSVNAFNAANIKQLYANNIIDYKAAAIASPNYNLKSGELIDIIRQAMTEKNLAKAEDALNVLASNGDEKAYATGFRIYASNLNDNEKEDNDITNHPLYNEKDFYTTASSSLPISKQTGLPINKIYIDNNGNHRPLYRRAISENYQGGFFMNYKIFG